MRKKAPVVVFAYKRLDKLKEVLSSLENAKYADETELYVFADGYKSDKDKDDVIAVQNFLSIYEKNDKFKKVEVYVSKNNKGLANSIISGVTDIINRYGRVIVLEDDIVVSGDFLIFMNDALDFFENNKKIWSIGGGSPDISKLCNYDKDIYCWYRIQSWGWASWSDRWEKINWDADYFAEFIKSPRIQYMFSRGGLDLCEMLWGQYNGRCDSWAIRSSYAECVNNMYTILPKYSRVRNIGEDGKGTHGGDIPYIGDDIIELDVPLKMEDVELDEELDKKLWKFYSFPYWANGFQYLRTVLAIYYYILKMIFSNKVDR